MHQFMVEVRLRNLLRDALLRHRPCTAFFNGALISSCNHTGPAVSIFEYTNDVRYFLRLSKRKPGALVAIDHFDR